MKQLVTLALLVSLAPMANAANSQVNRDKRKAAYTEAKTACLEENADLAGKQLQACVKRKMKKKKRVN